MQRVYMSVVCGVCLQVLYVYYVNRCVERMVCIMCMCIHLYIVHVYNVFICSLCMHVPCVCEGVCVYDVRGIYVGVCIHMWCLLVCMCLCGMFVCGVCGVCIACMMYVYVCGGMHTL